MGPALSWPAYAADWARLHGGYDPRGASPAARAWLRGAYHLGGALARAGASPGAVTAIGLLASLGVPLLCWAGGGWPAAAAALVTVTVVADATDGAVAVLTGRVTRRGYVYDSLVDRLAEASWLAAFWVLGAPGPLVVAAGAMCWLREYARARATAAGLAAFPPVAAGFPWIVSGYRPTQAALAFGGLLLAAICGLVGRDLVAGTVTIVAVACLLVAIFDLTRLLAGLRLVPR